MIIKNRGYAPGLALGRRQVGKVDHLVVLWLANRHEVYQLVIYMHEMMMQHLVIRQQQLLT